MQLQPTICNQVTLDLKEHLDERGVLVEIFRKSWMSKDDYWKDFLVLQQNFVRSKQNAIRGINLSRPGVTQRKILFCINGTIRDQLVDLRENSPTYMQKFEIVLSGAQPVLLFIPHGVGHSFQTLSEIADVIYMFDSEYDPVTEVSISPFDNEIGFHWKVPCLLSKKDRFASSWSKTKLKLENDSEG